MATRKTGVTMRRLGRPRKYNWDEWCDGAQWTIREGEDYAISTFHMQVTLHGRARVEGLKVSTQSFTEHSRGQTVQGLIFQFWSPEE